MPPIPRMAPRTPRSTPLERDVLAAIRLRLGACDDLVLWRNHIAHDEQWNPRTGGVSHARAGLPEGSADLVGILRVLGGIVTNDTFVPCAIGRFFALEVKRPRGGRQSAGQRQWGELVRIMGGFYAVVRSPDEAMAALERARRGACE
jgi:hypothetical protein